jgi:hypothetical protein
MPKVRVSPVDEGEREGWGMPDFLAIFLDAATEIFVGRMIEYITGQEM